ncbi:MAG: O-antigen ligase family protein [Bacteroidetes bacterium]|nr:O-antigen ligase family protein [Bacteroidota bacterium]
MTVKRHIPTLYCTGYILMLAGLPFSNFLMSVSQFVLAGTWLIEGNFREKFRNFFHNPVALLISSLFFLHLLGLAWTEDFGYGFHELRIKLPLLVLTLVISTSPALPFKTFKNLLLFFAYAVFTGTLVSTGEWLGINNELRKLTGLPEHLHLDNRSISLFISHIRFGLLICLAAFILVYLSIFRGENLPGYKKLIFLLTALWLFLFLFILGSLSGIFIATILLFAVCLSVISAKRFRIRAKLFSSAGILLLGVFWSWSGNTLLQPCDKGKTGYSVLEKVTTRGNPYVHDTLAGIFIDCRAVWINVCWPELTGAWNQRSKISFDSADMKGQPVRFTLVNFLTSKGLKKDMDGVMALSNEEIRAIEKGYTDVRALHSTDLMYRLKQISEDYRQYLRGGNPSGSSVMQRIEFWKAATGIILENPLLGVGTGDVPAAYQEQYEKLSSPLPEKFRLRAHNQFLAMGVSFGITGLTWFILTLLYPLFYKKKYSVFPYLAFFIIVFISLLSEDTLESQAGISFYVFFNCLFLFRMSPDDR